MGKLCMVFVCAVKWFGHASHEPRTGIWRENSWEATEPREINVVTGIGLNWPTI
jgi:hypothetical protein